MKILMIWFCVFVTNFCFSNSPHEFEGISEVYNIRNLRVLAQFLPNDPVIVECGAYKGRDTTKLAQGFPLARIYAFEPLRTAFFELSEIMKAYPGVSLFNQALDKTSGDKKFYICHGTYGQNPIFEFHSSLLKPTKSSRVHLMGPIETVPCVSLFNFCKDNRIDKIDMLWLSAEGNELQILEGAQALLWKVSLVYARSQLHSTRKSITLFDDLKRFMEKNNFILLSHFYFPNIHGDALFIRRDLFAK